MASVWGYHQYIGRRRILDGYHEYNRRISRRMGGGGGGH